MTSRVDGGSAEVLFSGTAAVSLVYVSFSYSGWNAAAYVAGEVQRPGWTLPRALLLGTGVVTALYVGLNTVFVASAPMERLAGQVEVAHVAAASLFGPAAALWVSLVVAVGLATTVGALIMTGPRIYDRMGRDHPRLALLAGSREGRGPVRAILLQTAVALVLTLSATFDLLLTYIGFTLTLSSGLTLAGVFVLRHREPDLERPLSRLGTPADDRAGAGVDGVDGCLHFGRATRRGVGGTGHDRRWARALQADREPADKIGFGAVSDTWRLLWGTEGRRYCR